VSSDFASSEDLLSAAVSVFLGAISYVYADVENDELDSTELLITETTAGARSGGTDLLDDAKTNLVTQFFCPGYFEDDSAETLFTIFIGEFLVNTDCTEILTNTPLSKNVLESVRPVWSLLIVIVLDKIAYVSMITIALLRPMASSLIMGSAFGELTDLLSDQTGQISDSFVLTSAIAAPLAIVIAILKLLTGFIHAYILQFFSIAILESVN